MITDVAKGAEGMCWCTGRNTICWGSETWKKQETPAEIKCTKTLRPFQVLFLFPVRGRVGFWPSMKKKKTIFLFKFSFVPLNSGTKLVKSRDVVAFLLLNIIHQI